MSIYPVILHVPDCIYIYKHNFKLKFIRLIAKKSVYLSSKKSKLYLDCLLKNKKGVPVKSNGVYWSISHKTKYVGGVVSSIPVGIDIEEVLPRSKILYSKIANLHEWSLRTEDSERLLFFRYWTAKEAVLKAEGVGLIGLSNCFIEKIINKFRMIVSYNSYLWNVEHFYVDNHVVAIAINDFDTIWSLCKIKYPI